MKFVQLVKSTNESEDSLTSSDSDSKSSEQKYKRQATQPTNQVHSTINPFIVERRKCRRNEVFFNCIPTACEPTCDEQNPPICIPIICVPGCQCKSGFVRNKQNTCVSKDQCQPACGRNEVFLECGTACEPTCNDPNPTVCTFQCVTGCQCKIGFVRNNQGVCVTEDQCVRTCKINETFKTCGTACEPSCANPRPGLCPAICIAKCQCNSGFLRNSQNNCVRPNDCPIGTFIQNATLREIQLKETKSK